MTGWQELSGVPYSEKVDEKSCRVGRAERNPPDHDNNNLHGGFRFTLPTLQNQIQKKEEHGGFRFTLPTLQNQIQKKEEHGGFRFTLPTLQNQIQRKEEIKKKKDNNTLKNFWKKIREKKLKRDLDEQTLEALYKAAKNLGIENGEWNTNIKCIDKTKRLTALDGVVFFESELLNAEEEN
ncbi:hypothetical protein [Candidatus Marithrix sp. Canyon 246]|nr:hypothetical protein [Candidatus Marithrix sp. Canyon 246]